MPYADDDDLARDGIIGPSACSSRRVVICDDSDSVPTGSKATSGLFKRDAKEALTFGLLEYGDLCLSGSFGMLIIIGILDVRWVDLVSL